MQFTRTFVTLALAVSAIALPDGGGSCGGSGGSSGDGSDDNPPVPQCCQNVQNSNSVDSVTKSIIFAVIGIDISTVSVPIGTGCTPIAIPGGFSCQTNTVSCRSVLARQLIGINCIPITLSF